MTAHIERVEPLKTDDARSEAAGRKLANGVDSAPKRAGQVDAARRDSQCRPDALDIVDHLSE